MRGRSIHNNIRLVIDLLDYRHLIEDDGFILFLDFNKAFNSIEHPFILQCILGFGDKFQNPSKHYLLYLQTWVKQGCPISPHFFLAATKMLSVSIKNSNIAPLSVPGIPTIISQLADDMTILMKQLTGVRKIMQIYFPKSLGLKLNLNKCELLPIHQSE